MSADAEMSTRPSGLSRINFEDEQRLHSPHDGIA